MDYINIRDRVRRIENLLEFAARSEIPRRTLQRVRSGVSVNLRTLNRIEAALKQHKPKMRPAKAEPTSGVDEAR